MINQHVIETAHKQIIEAANDMLCGRISFIEGSRRLLFLQMKAEIPEADPDFGPFMGINSESISFPLGEERKLWNPQALAKLQTEIDRVETWARSFGMAACEHLIHRFSPKNSA